MEEFPLHYTLVLLIIAVGLVLFGPAVAVLALSKGMLLFLLLAGLVSLVAETSITS
jgi:hypothetical protein